MSNPNINLKAGNHRLNINGEGQFHCLLCNCVGWAEELPETCQAPDSEREDFDARFSVEPEIRDAHGRHLEIGMMVAGIPENGDRERAVRACKLLEYCPGTALPFITTKGAFRTVAKDHQPEMYNWIRKHVLNPEQVLP